MPLGIIYIDEGSQSPTQRADLAGENTDFIVKELGKPQQYTWVMIHEILEDDRIVDRFMFTELNAILSAPRIFPASNITTVVVGYRPPFRPIELLSLTHGIQSAHTAI
jgi:phenylpyruvate tautomerase PptA (4-oxalocrotonate tautomerase family)